MIDEFCFAIKNQSDETQASQALYKIAFFILKCML